MPRPLKSFLSPLSLGLVGVWLLALVTRFWGLTRFNTLVFDEVYFARFGRNYLAGLPLFDAHPPLGKYLIALGIYLSGHFDPWGYRWLNALTGSLIPLLVAGVAACLWRKPLFIFLAAFLTSLDGLLLVESRYALINIYLLFFGLLGQWLWLLGSEAKKSHRGWYLVGAGVSLGACVAVKWSGLGYVLGLYGGWGIAKICGWAWGYRHGWGQSFQAWGRWSLIQMGLVLPGVMVGFYGLAWAPHLQLNPKAGLWKLHQQLYTYHRSISDTAHPYCSNWLSWPWAIRPVSYFYLRAPEVLPASADPPLIGPPIPWQNTVQIYDVHAQFNPPLVWLSSLAILVLVMLVLRGWARGLGWIRPDYGQQRAFLPWGAVTWLGVNYGANLLPWAVVGRCLFIYHYLPAALFSFMGLALGMAQAWCVGDGRWRGLVIGLGTLIVLGFLFWLPIFLGLPLAPSSFNLRIWFPSWL